MWDAPRSAALQYCSSWEEAVVYQLPYELKEEFTKSRDLASRFLTIHCLDIEGILPVSLISVMGMRCKKRLHQVWWKSLMEAGSSLYLDSRSEGWGLMLSSWSITRKELTILLDWDLPACGVRLCSWETRLGISTQKCVVTAWWYQCPAHPMA